MSEPLCRDFIFPICECAPNEGGGGFRFVRFLGTGFLFGSAGFALTASHVLGSPTDQRLLMAMFVAPNQHWLGARILRRHIHPTEDVAVIQLEPVSGLPWYSPFGLSSTPAHSSCRYSLFGYPEDVANELVNESTSRVETRPDLVYSEGHVRRRATLALPSVRGSAGVGPDLLHATVGVPPHPPAVLVVLVPRALGLFGAVVVPVGPRPLLLAAVDLAMALGHSRLPFVVHDARPEAARQQGRCDQRGGDQ